MAKLRVKDRVALGAYLIEAARCEIKRKQLMSDPVTELAPYVEIPKNHTIAVHSDSETVTNIMIPFAEDIEYALSTMRNSPYGYPPQYTPSSTQYIDPNEMPEDPVNEPPKSYQFRVGDYTLSRCG